MPFSKTYRKPAKKTRKRRPKTTDGRQNQRIKKLENIVYPGIEKKVKDLATIEAAISTGSYVNQPMLQIAQGDNSDQRNGDKVQLLSMRVYSSILKGDTNNTIRVMWVATPSTQTLAITDVLDYASYASHGDLVFSSPYRLVPADAEKTYSVLFDKVYNITANDSQIQDRYNLKLPKKGRPCAFVGTGSVQPNNFKLHLIAISDSAGVAHPKLSTVLRSSYNDL